MRQRLILAWLLAALPATPGWAVQSGRLEGRVIGLDGRPASGYQLHLIGSDGTEAARVRTDSVGTYTIDSVPPGRYGLAVADRAGRIAPVSGPPLRLPAGRSVRRDLKLLETRPGRRQQAVAGNYSLGKWWSGLSTHARAWIVIAAVVGAWFTYEALTTEDDERETAASPS